MSVTKRIRYGVVAAVLVSVLLSGCGRKSQLAGQTGAQKVTTSTEATTTTAVPLVTLNPPTTIIGAGPEVVEGQASKANTVVITNGTFSPSTLTVKVGDLVTFKGGDPNPYDVVVGGLDAQTVTENLLETYSFRAPGTVVVSQDFNSDTMTITVTGSPADGSTSATTTTVAATTGTTTTVAGGSTTSSTTALNPAAGGASGATGASTTSTTTGG